MKKYILKRLFFSIITLLTILFVLFLLLEFMPGTPFNDERLTSSQKEILLAKYSLDQPIVIRFITYVKNMLTGDFGVSYAISQNTEITELLKNRIGISLHIGGQAVLIGTAIGLLLGTMAALLHNTPFDTLASVISVIGVSVPAYVFALALAYAFGYKLQILPLIYDAEKTVQSSILPSISLSMLTMSTVARFTRSELLSVLNSEYMDFIRTKGITGPKAILNHGLRNAVIPVITALAPLIVGLLTGSLVVEKIFSIPGIGSLLVTAIQVNDYNVILTIMFLYSAIYIGIMLIVDILYCVIDPRIRIQDENAYE